jgi:hypothetical protein
LIPSNSPAAQQVMAGSVTAPVWTGVPPPPVFQKPGISPAAWRFIGWGGAIGVGIFILLVVIGTLLPSSPNQSDASQPSAPQAAPPPNGPVANPLTLNVRLNLSRIENTDQGPILVVETNLPPKMALMATILGNGHGAQAEGIVPANHVVRFGPFFNGSLSPGVYSVEVDMAETAESDSIFGEYWQGLTGPAVITKPGTPMKMVSQTFHFKINPDGSLTNPFPEPTQPAPDSSAAPAVSYDISTSREFAVPSFERCLMRTAMANHLTSASPEAVRQLLDACPNTSHGYVGVCLGDLGQTEMGCDMATGVLAASVLNHINPAKGGVNSTAQPAPQAELHFAPAPAPALSFQPSPESTDITPAPVASRQETSGSPSAPQITKVTQGQTPDQVVAILGPPISITTGPPPVYNYPHLSIVFARGKVWKIHQFQ